MNPVITKDVLLVGAGHAHVAVLRAFGMRPIDGVRLTLLTREVETPYSGMLPGLIAGHYTFDQAHIDAGRLAQFAGARLYRDEAVGIDLAQRRVMCRDRPPVPYDLLSLDIGSRPNTADVPGAASHAISVKPIGGFLAQFERMLARVRDGASHRVLMVGGGAGGVELLLALQARLSAQAPNPASMRFALVTASATLLPGFPAGFARRLAALLARRGVAVTTGARVVSVEPGRACLDAGGRIEADEIVWATEAAPATWLGGTGLALEGGFLGVDAYLRASPDVFAAGDMIAFPDPIARSGVYAVRAGPVLAANLRARLTGRPLRRYRPQKTALVIVSTGARHAVLTRNGVTASGAWAWRLKDRIDRRWMARYTDLPAMAPSAATSVADAPPQEMRCGGCGAKVGADALSRALAPIVPWPRRDVLVGLEAPDDAAVVDTGGPLLSVQSVDYFRAMIDDPYRFGMIAANHALGDLFAMGAAPQTALAIATLPFGPEAKIENALADLMAGANAVLRAAGCALVGGHTSEGAELSLGFAVNGLIARDRLLRKSGLRPGDALILTKKLGTGTLLAAHMRGQAKARWIEAAIAHMTESAGPAAAILAQYGAHAATDVTGFGLLGHLLEMTRASGVGATLTLSDLPVLDGAEATLAAGLISSLHPANLRFQSSIREKAAAGGQPRYGLLFDPQTAGGLLAGLPAAQADACLAALRAAGLGHAAVIGRVDPPSAVPIGIVA